MKALLIFIVLLTIPCYAQRSSEDISVTFRVVPEFLPRDSTIYVAGNQPELGMWYPREFPLNRKADGSWSRSLKFKTGTHLEFKFTRGSWDTEAVDSNGIEFPNFVLDVQKDTILTVEISNWRDTFKGETLLSLQRLRNKAGNIELLENWKYHSGDNPQWADPDFDDSDWEVVDTRLRPNNLPESGWNGIGWFRLHLTVDSSLWNVPLAIYNEQNGASEIFLNGNLIYRLGEIGSSEKDQVTFIQRIPRYIIFSDTRNQVLAVRYSNYSWKKIHQFGGFAGFGPLIGDLNDYVAGSVSRVRQRSIYQLIFTSVPLTLALIHLLLFLFYREGRENLFYSICMVGFAGLSYANFQPLTDTFQEVINLNLIGFLSINTAIVFGLLTIYWRSYKKIPKRITFFVIVPIILGIIEYFFPERRSNSVFYIFLAIVALEMLRIIIFPLFKKEKKEWLIGIGFIVLIVVIFLQILIGTEIINPIFGNEIVYVYGIFFLSLAVSTDLAKNFAQTHQQLLEKEREARENEIERRILEADVARKTQELEEARKIQLSMLPKTIPKLPDLDIAVYMKTATEVGGDYYDFIQSDDGSLTIAIGDATGHGTKAGIMVTLAKSLFRTMGHTFYLPDFLNHSSKMIQRMNLGNLFMAMLIIRLKNQKMILSSAGMPPVLIFREKSRSIEEIVIKGIPLGSSLQYKYQQKNATLNTGDKILLMSDGFAELFNDKKEMLDYPKINQLFLKNAEKSPNEIISSLVNFAEEWRNENPQNDDITFVVIKIK